MSGIAERAATRGPSILRLGTFVTPTENLVTTVQSVRFPSYSSIDSKVHWTTGIHSSSMSWQKRATRSSSVIRKSVRRRETQQRAWTKRPGMLPLSLGL